MLSRSSDRPNGEFTLGSALLVHIRPTLKIIPLKVPQTIEDLALPVWEGNDKTAFILTSAGVYSVDAETGVAKLIVRGTLAGLAISPNGNRLAFWNLGTKGNMYTLSVFDLRSNHTIRVWKIPTRFDSDQYGHEIAFSSDGYSIFAKTYDEENRTPLKKFSIRTGNVQEIWPDCVGLARSNRTVYFIGRDHGVSTLFKIEVSNDSPKKVKPNFEFDSLTGNGSHRWVIATNTRSNALSVLDFKTNEIQPLPSYCESAGAVAEEKVVCSRGGELLELK